MKHVRIGKVSIVALPQPLSKGAGERRKRASRANPSVRYEPAQIPLAMKAAGNRIMIARAKLATNPALVRRSHHSCPRRAARNLLKTGHGMTRR